MGSIKSYRELRVYRSAFDTAMEIFEPTKNFPPEERYSLTDQIRRSSRSVCQAIGESWRKRRYPKHFVSKLSDAEAEDERYDHILAQLVRMANNADRWCNF